MKHLALAIAAILMLAVVAPVFAQPFADVPAEHWAFDAIAELAAKGILEGFPDGTFKGDRAMTRYEMAMALARILARIEAIKIPPPPKIPPPEVTRADVDRLTRLLNEFRAELSALGVRITAVEEELAALRARVNADTTRVTGDFTYVYFTGSIPTLDRTRIRLTFRGQPAPDLLVTLRARWNTRWPSSDVTDFDRLIVAWSSPWGLTFTGGRQYWALGPQGLLLSLQDASRDGAQVTGSFGGITLTGIAFWSQNATNPDETIYAARAAFTPMAGWTFGLNYRLDRIPTIGNTGSMWSFDVEGALIPGVSLLAEYASWNPTGGCATSGPIGGCTALFAQLSFDLGALAGMSQFSPMLNVFYKDYRSDFQNACQTDNTGSWCGNLYNTHWGLWLGGDMSLVTAWGADLTLQVLPKLSVLVGYEVGTMNNATGFVGGFTQGDDYTGLMIRGDYSLTRNTTLSLEYYSLVNTTTDVSHLGSSGYALRLFTSW